MPGFFGVLENSSSFIGHSVAWPQDHYSRSSSHHRLPHCQEQLGLKKLIPPFSSCHQWAAFTKQCWNKLVHVQVVVNSFMLSVLLPHQMIEQLFQVKNGDIDPASSEF